MSDDLDDFLRQAAERRQKRQQQKSGKPAAPPPQPSQPSKPAPQNRNPPKPAPLKPSLPEAPRELRPSGTNFDTIIAQTHVESDLSFADERMEEHLKEVFRSDMAPEGKRSNRKASRGDEKDDMSAYAPIGAIQARAMVTSGELIHQLRDPKTLRLAVIAFEVLRRPYQ